MEQLAPIINIHDILVNSKRKYNNEQFQELIITDDWVYPPVQRNVKEILISQFVTAFMDQYVQNTTEEKIDKKGKFPIPLIFAFVANNLKRQKHGFAIKILQNHVDKMNTQNCHIVNYNIAKIYQSMQNWEKNIFYLESVLRQEPFFGDAVRDLCLNYALRQNRRKQAIDLLQRHLKSTKIINIGLIHSSYIYINAKYRLRGIKEIMKHLHNQQLSITNYYNLGVLLKQNEEYQKALEIFTQIWSKLNTIKKTEQKRWNPKDQRLLILTKVNIMIILQFISKMSKDLLEPFESLPKLILNSHKTDLKMWDIKAIQQNRNSKANMNQKQVLDCLTSYLSLQSKQPRMTKHFRFNKAAKENQQKQHSFQEQFSNIRQHNNKKLKYLLIKQKQINNFFKNLVIRKENGSQKYKFLYQGQQKTIDMSENQTLIKRAKASLKNEEFQMFEKEFEQKRKMHQFKYNNVQIQQMISEVITNLDEYKEQKNSKNIWKNIVKFKSLPKNNKISQNSYKKQSLKTIHSPKALNSQRSEKKFRIDKKVEKIDKIKKVQVEREHKTIILQMKRDSQFKEKQTESKFFNSLPPIFKPIQFEDNIVQHHDSIVHESKEIVKETKVISEPKIEEKRLSSRRKTEEKDSTILKEQQKRQNLYDPLASSFQLTGFKKSSLAKFMENKARVSELKQQSQIENNTEEKQIKKQTQNIQPLPQSFLFPRQIVSQSQFEEDLAEGYDLEKQGKYEQSFEKYTIMYKVYKQQNEKQQILLRIAGLFERQQKNLQAQKTYHKCIKFNNIQAFLRLGNLLMRNGRIKSGVQNIEKANCLKRDDLQIQNKLVYGYSLSEETMEKALILAHTILKKQPESLETLVMTANILEKQGKIKEAIEIVTAIDNVKQAEYIKHYLGLLYLSNSNFTEAFNYFKAALAIKPDHVPSLIQIATIISDLSPKQSISILNKVLEIDPHNRKALARLGKIYESIENDFDKAMTVYRTALESQENYESYMKIGDCFAKQQSYLQALLNYKEALSLKKTHEVLAKIGKMLEKKNQHLKAIQNYENAIDLLQKEKEFSREVYLEYMLALGKIQILALSYDSAIQCFEEIMQDNETIELNKLIAEAYFGKREYKIALTYYEKANLLCKGTSVDILQSMAICFDKMQEYLASKAIYEKILQEYPENIKCMNNLGNILLITGETNEAFYFFESMLQKIPKNIEKRLKVADIYAQVGDWSKVQYHLLQCLKIKEHDSRVLQKLIVLYKEKRETRLVAKYEKKLNLLKVHNKQKAM